MIRLQFVRQLALAALLLLLSLDSGAMAQSVLPFELPKREDLLRIRSALLITDRGEIALELFPEVAPRHVANFKYLADKGFYRNSRFHLHYPNYIIQAGQLSRLSGREMNYSLSAEFSDLRHEEGTLGMARRPDDMNQERSSSGTQFHLLLGDAPRMNGSYTVFGRVIKGIEVLRRLRKGDMIRDLRVFVEPPKTKNPG